MMSFDLESLLIFWYRKYFGLGVTHQPVGMVRRRFGRNYRLHVVIICVGGNRKSNARCILEWQGKLRSSTK